MTEKETICNGERKCKFSNYDAPVEEKSKRTNRKCRSPTRLTVDLEIGIYLYKKENGYVSFRQFILNYKNMS